MKMQTLAAFALAAAFAAPAFAADNMSADTTKSEKCYGVAKSGKNDCKSATNATCAGHSMKDGDKGAFILVPAGTCEKLVGGSLNG